MTGKTPEHLTQEIASYITPVALDILLPGLDSYPLPPTAPLRIQSWVQQPLADTPASNKVKVFYHSP